MKAVKDPRLLKFATVFVGLAFLISFTLGLFSKFSVFTLLLRPIFMSAIMGLLAIISFILLYYLVPEALEISLFGRNSSLEMEESSLDLSDQKLEEEFQSQKKLPTEPTVEGLTKKSNYTRSPQHPSIRKNKTASDQILVEGVAIKNEPKLMADAIRHLIDDDQE